MKKTPQRKCIGCNEMKDKKDLIRAVRSPEGDISVDLTGKKNGRGCYICKGTECFEKVRKGKKLEKTFKMQIPQEIYDELEAQIISLQAGDNSGN